MNTKHKQKLELIILIFLPMLLSGVVSALFHFKFIVVLSIFYGATLLFCLPSNNALSGNLDATIQAINPTYRFEKSIFSKIHNYEVIGCSIVFLCTLISLAIAYISYN